MSLKKRMSKSIALALVGIIIATPTMNSVYALENNQQQELQLNEEEQRTSQERSIALGLAIPGTAIAPGVFKAVGLVGFTIMNIYYRSQGTAREVDSAWDRIPSKLKDPNGSVGIGKFDQRLSKGERKNSKTGWVLSPDKSGHKGSKWKLKDSRGNRVASLDSEGRVVGK